MPTRIGIALCLDEHERWRKGRQYEYIDCAYVRAISEAGGQALYLPIQDAAEDLVSELDGLLLPGGDDFAPAKQDSYPAEVFNFAPQRLIEFHSTLLKAALLREIPVFGICFGMQLMACLEGGKLDYHLPQDRPDSFPHQLTEASARHSIEIEPGSLLAQALQCRETDVNSRHHQAVAAVGSNWKISARSSDGVIEAIERKESLFTLGVQWHPESMGDSHRTALFQEFVDAASR